MRIGRWILIGVAALLAILVIAVVAVVLLVDPNRFKGEIESRFATATGRELHLTGDIEIDFLPWLALTTGESRLANPAGFSSPDLATWREARVGVRFWPLLRGELDVDRIRFVGLDARLEKNTAGETNWAFGTEETQADTPFDPASLPNIAGLELRDATLQYLDVAANTRVRLSEWSLDLEPLRPGTPIDVETSFIVQASPDLPEAKLTIQGEVELGRAIAVRNLELAGHASGAALGNDEVPVALEAKSLSLDLDATRLDAPAWSLQLGDLRARGSAAGSFGEAGTMSGSLQAEAGSLRKVLAAVGVAMPATADPAVFGRFELDASIESNDAGLVGDLRKLTLDDTQLMGRVTRAAEEGAVIEFALEGDRMAIARYLEPKDASSEPFQFPGEMLRSLPVRGTLTLQEATFDAVVAKGVSLKVEHGDSPAARVR